jgi:hypothetical protein
MSGVANLTDLLGGFALLARWWWGKLLTRSRCSPHSNNVGANCLLYLKEVMEVQLLVIMPVVRS